MQHEVGRNELVSKAAGSILTHGVWFLTLLEGKGKLLNVFCSLSIPVDSTSSCVVIRLSIFTLGRRIGYPIDSWPYIIHLTQQPRPSPYNKQGCCPHIMTSLRVAYEFQGPDEGTRGVYTCW